jgi:uncharacterized delta-60 repeat protein
MTRKLAIIAFVALSAALSLLPGRPEAASQPVQAPVHGHPMHAFSGTTLSGSPGDLDPTFDGDGKVVTDFGGWESAMGVAVQADGKIVAAGGTYDSVANTSDFALARYNADGSLDSAFGSGGKVRTEIVPNGFAWAYAVAIQRDGKIVVAGSAAAADDDVALARYNPDGSLDSTFGLDGKVVTNLGQSDYAYGLAIQPDGKLVVVGQTAALMADRDFALARYNPDGSLDATFGGAGFVITPSLDSAESVVIQPDGKIVAAGFADDTAGSVSLGLARYNPDGSLDASFDGDGTVETRDLWGAASVALQTDGKIVATAGGMIARYTASGSLDPGFGSNGTSTAGGWATVVLVQADRKLIVAGITGSLEDNDFFVARLLQDGSPDIAFGQNGQVQTDLGANSYDSVLAATLQADNRIVVAGSTRPNRDSPLRDFAVVRYLSEPPCRVPNVRGKKLAVARSAISKAHCSLGKVKRKKSKRVKRNRVIAQSPKAGTQLPNLGKVNLVLSRGRR